MQDIRTNKKNIFYRLLSYAYGLVVGPIIFFTTIFWVIAFWPIPIKERLFFIGPLWKSFSYLIITVGCRTRFYWEDRRSENKGKTGKGLIITNHQSFLDIPAVAFMHRTAPLMKWEVIYIPFFGAVALASGAITVRRGNRNSRAEALKKCCERLKKGVSVQYYPEGTRSKNGRPKPLEQIKKPLFKFVYENNIPVTPVSLYGTNGVLSPFGEVTPGHVGHITHSEVYPEDFNDLDSFIAVCWNKVTSGFEELEQKCSKKS